MHGLHGCLWLSLAGAVVPRKQAPLPQEVTGSVWLTALVGAGSEGLIVKTESSGPILLQVASALVGDGTCSNSLYGCVTLTRFWF